MPADTESRPAETDHERVSPGEMPPPEAFKAAVGRMSEVVGFVRRYYVAQFDLAKLRVRQAIILAALGVVALIALIALIVTLMVLLLIGLSGAASEALRAPAWAGYLLVSIGAIAIAAISGWIFLRRTSRKRYDATVKRYAGPARNENAPQD